MSLREFHSDSQMTFWFNHINIRCWLVKHHLPSTDPEPVTLHTGRKNRNLCQTIYSVLITCHNWSKWHPYWRNCLGYERFPCYKRHKFSPIAHGYNRQERPFQARVNNWPVMSPQRKGQLPQYSRGQLELRHGQFNELESMEVFQKPEDVGVTVKYLNLSFLVKKASVDSALLLSFPK